MTIIQYPYSFKQFNEKILVVNAVGEHVFLSHQDFDYLVSENYDCLSEEGKLKLFSHNFISDINDKELVENLLAIKLRSRKDFLRYFTRLHMIVLTLRCNCHCDYCHASSKNLMAKNLDMTVETAKHVLDVIFQSPSPVLKIEFQGGEPTLNWPVLQYIVLSGEKKAVKTGKEIGFVVCTNLMSLTDKQVEFCKQHNIDISSSCDGPKFYHDLHRHALDKTSSYEAFLSNLKRIRKYKGKNSVNALLTITKDNLNHLPEIIDHYVALGFNSIFLRSLNPYGYAKKNLDELGYSFTDFVKYYKLALEYIFQLNESGIFFMESYASLIFQRIMTPFSTGFVDLQSPTGAGISGAIYYYNGDVYPSDEGRMLATMGDTRFKLGNVYDSNFRAIFSSNVMQDLVKSSIVESMPMCTTCVYNPYCGADPVRYYNESGDFLGHRYSSGFCQRNMGIIQILMDIIKENNPHKMEILWSWVRRRPLEDCQCGQ